MPLPYNTTPMMTGQGPFGSVEMGGMFTVLKVRADQKPGDYKNTGWFKHPAGTVAYELKGELPAPARFQSEGSGSMPAQSRTKKDVEVQIRKPSGHTGH